MHALSLSVKPPFFHSRDTRADLIAEQDSLPDALFGFVTARRLIALGILANAFFWSGLLTPFSAGADPEVAYLHAFVMMLGVGLALGGAVAVVMMAVHHVDVRMRSPELAAAVLHMTVVGAFAILVASASLRGLA